MTTWYQSHRSTAAPSDPPSFGSGWAHAPSSVSPTSIAGFLAPASWCPRPPPRLQSTPAPAFSARVMPAPSSTPPQPSPSPSIFPVARASASPSRSSPSDLHRSFRVPASLPSLSTARQPAGSEPALDRRRLGSRAVSSGFQPRATITSRDGFLGAAASSSVEIKLSFFGTASSAATATTAITSPIPSPVSSASTTISSPTDEELAFIQERLDQLLARLDSFHTNQQQLVSRSEFMAKMVEQNSKDQQQLARQLERTAQAGARITERSVEPGREGKGSVKNIQQVMWSSTNNNEMMPVRCAMDGLNQDTMSMALKTVPTATVLMVTQVNPFLVQGKVEQQRKAEIRTRLEQPMDVDGGLGQLGASGPFSFSPLEPVCLVPSASPDKAKQRGQPKGSTNKPHMDAIKGQSEEKFTVNAGASGRRIMDSIFASEGSLEVRGGTYITLDALAAYLKYLEGTGKSTWQELHDKVCLAETRDGASFYTLFGTAPHLGVIFRRRVYHEAILPHFLRHDILKGVDYLIMWSATKQWDPGIDFLCLDRISDFFLHFPLCTSSFQELIVAFSCMCKAAPLVLTECLNSGSYPCLALACRILGRKEVMHLWWKSKYLAFSSEEFLTRKISNKQDYITTFCLVGVRRQCLVPSVWWLGSSKDAVSMTLSMATLSNAIKIEELHWELGTLAARIVSLKRPWDPGVQLIISLLGLSSEHQLECVVVLLALLSKENDEGKWAITVAGIIQATLEFLRKKLSRSIQMSVLAATSEEKDAEEKDDEVTLWERITRASNVPHKTESISGHAFAWGQAKSQGGGNVTPGILWPTCKGKREREINS